MFLRRNFFFWDYIHNATVPSNSSTLYMKRNRISIIKPVNYEKLIRERILNNSFPII